VTRDEAVKLASAAWDKNVHKQDTGYCIFEVLVALGVIKTEEPKAPAQRLCEALGWPLGSRSEGEMHLALANANLQIVEKTS
jgi:hypothetical protein